MKKIIATIAITVTIGIIGSQIANAHWGEGAGLMHRGFFNNQETTNEYLTASKQFYTDTVELRKEIALKRNDLMIELAKAPVIEDGVDTLRSELFDLQEALNNKAAESGIDWGHGGMMGYRNGPGSCWNTAYKK